MERRTFERGDTIFQEGDASDCAYLIVVGSVTAHLPNGQVRTLGRGEVFGEMGLLDEKARSATVQAVEHTVCASYSEDELIEAIRNSPEEAIALVKALIQRLREANAA